MGFMLKPVMPGLAAFAKATAAWHRKSPSKPRRGRVPGTTSSLLLKEKDVDGSGRAGHDGRRSIFKNESAVLGKPHLNSRRARRHECAGSRRSITSALFDG
jgi:hypothetical protein